MRGLGRILAGIAILAGLAGIAAGLWEAAEPAPESAVEPDYFAFVKPTAQAQPAPAPAPTVAAPDTAGGPMQASQVELAVQKLRAAGAGEDVVYRLRAASLSGDTAARLAAMELEELTWRRRIDAYLAERGSLMNGQPGMDTDQAAALQQLRDARFSAEEQSRLAASLPAPLQLTRN